MTDTDRMRLLGALPEIDFSTDTPVYVDREVHRDYDTILIPSARLDRRGRDALRALLDRCENEIAVMRLRDIDLERDCDQANPETGAWCHRGGDHGVHRDTNGDQWRTDGQRCECGHPKSRHEVMSGVCYCGVSGCDCGGSRPAGGADSIEGEGSDLD